MFAVVEDSDAVVLVGVEGCEALGVSSELQPESRPTASNGATIATARGERCKVVRPEVGWAFPIRGVVIMGETVARSADTGAGFPSQEGEGAVDYSPLSRTKM